MLEGSCDESWHGQAIGKQSVLEFANIESVVTIQWRFGPNTMHNSWVA
jgi:hypothetical protein